MGSEAVGREQAGLLRRLLLWVVLIGIVGLGLELLLLEHTESVKQLVPFSALGAALVTGLWLALRPGRAAVISFGVVMAATIVIALLGLYFHYVGNRAFELEMDPSGAGWLLVWRSLRGATPALAPGAMAQVGLLGLLVVFRHPALRPGRRGAINDEYEQG